VSRGTLNHTQSKPTPYTFLILWKYVRNVRIINESTFHTYAVIVDSDLRTTEFTIRWVRLMQQCDWCSILLQIYLLTTVVVYFDTKYDGWMLRV